MTRRIVRRGAMAFLLSATVASAQNTLQLDDGDAVESTAETGQTQTTQEAQTAAQAASSSAQTQDAAQTRRVAQQSRSRGFVLRDVQFVGRSSYVSDAQLAAAEASVRGARILSAQGISQVGAVLTQQLYGRQGLTTAQAVIRNVNARTGVLTVELLEARVGQVRYTSNLLSDRYLDYRLNVTPGALADNRRINEQLDQFRLTDGITLGASYTAGANFGETDVNIGHSEIPRHSTTITIDNYGAPASGKAQLTLAHTIRSVTGWNDPVNLSFSLREGSRALSLGYSRIVSRGGARASVSVSGSNTNTLGALPVTGARRDVALGLNLPVILSDERRSNISFGLAGFTETSDFLGVRILDQTGREASIGASEFRQFDNATLTVGGNLTFGQYNNAVTGQSAVNYSFASANVAYARNLGPSVFAAIQLAGQAKIGGTLPASRQFTVTSPSGVRGYPTNLSSGSEGLYARMQLEKTTPYNFGGASVGARPFAFFDIGEARDSTGARLGQARSVGIGTSFTAGGGVFGDLFIARPLNTNITGWTNPSTAPMIGGSIAIQF